MEAKWLGFLIQNGLVEAKKLGCSQTEAILRLKRFSQFSEADFESIKAFEKRTNHDIKAVEYFVRAELGKLGFGDDLKEYTHFLCTSEDINNLAYSLLITEFNTEVLNPKIGEIVGALVVQARRARNAAMLSRTHGQPATPTTLGKEIANFAFRLNGQLVKLSNHRFSAKMNGAVGNYNAHYFVDPAINWLGLTRQFIEEDCKLRFNPFTTQIEPHDSLCEYFAIIAHLNTIALGLCQDTWGYISRGYFRLAAVEGEVGSSIMPHKVNPIDFENAEGNIGLANALFEHFGRKLPVSRFQRDLSDSTVLRNIGVAMGHSMLAYHSMLTGLSKLEPDEALMREELEAHVEVLAEPIQQLLRTRGFENAYEQLKAFTRGRRITRADLDQFIAKLPIDEPTRSRLLALTPSAYIGIAPKLVDLLDDLLK